MRIKPTYEKTYIIRYRRGKDVQTTEVVETTEDEIHVLISETFKGKFMHPKRKSGEIPATHIQVIELDNIKKSSRVSYFCYTKNGKDFMKSFAIVYNLSPREVRIELEKAIRSSK